MSTLVVAECGINHNGSLDIAKKIIDTAAVAGCDYVKFQKRTSEVCVPEHKKSQEKKTPWGIMTYLDYRKRVEFGFDSYREIDQYCDSRGIEWFASVWDGQSAKVMKRLGREIVKIPSAHLTNDELLKLCRELFELVILSTGMSTEQEIEHAVKIGAPDYILHCNSSYPARVDELNLAYITHLQEKYLQSHIGYSGHEYGLVTTFAAVAMGAEMVERHVTLDRLMWGSDQMASVEPIGLMKLVKGIRDIDGARGVSEDRVILPSEEEKRKALRR